MAVPEVCDSLFLEVKKVVRGCQKKIVYLKNTGSEVFDEAYFVVNDKIFRYVHINIQNSVYGQKCLCVYDTAVCRIIQRSFKPLRRGSDCAVHGQGN